MACLFVCLLIFFLLNRFMAAEFASLFGQLWLVETVVQVHWEKCIWRCTLFQFWILSTLKSFKLHVTLILFILLIKAAFTRLTFHISSIILVLLVFMYLSVDLEHKFSQNVTWTTPVVGHIAISLNLEMNAYFAINGCADFLFQSPCPSCANLIFTFNISEI